MSQTAISSEAENAQQSSKAFLDSLLAPAQNPQHRAEILMTAQINFGEIGQKATEIIALTQEIIERERSWENLEIDQETMWERINYENVIKPAVEAYRRTDLRCQKHNNGIVTHWGDDWRAGFNLLPDKQPENMLASIRRLSAKMTLEEAEIRLTKAVNHRLTNWRRGQRTTTIATTSDFLSVERTSHESIHESIEDTQGSSNVATTQIHSSAGAEVIPHNLEEPHIRPTERKRRRLWTLEDEDGDEENTATHTNISLNEETNDESGNEEEIEVDEGSEEDIEVDEGSEAEIELPRYCTCINKSAVQTKLANAKRRGFEDRAALIKDIEFLIPSVVDDMCWAHLRVFATSVGLRTQIGGRKNLTQRIEKL